MIIQQLRLKYQLSPILVENTLSILFSSSLQIVKIQFYYVATTTWSVTVAFGEPSSIVS